MIKTALIILGLSASVAMAHDAPSGWKYPFYCCNGQDCSPIPMTKVKVVQGGYLITLEKSDHVMLTRPGQWFVPQTEARVSPDDQAHICFYPTETTVRCFFVPPMGF